MATAVFDILAFTKKLTNAGFTPMQAESLAEAMHEITMSELATKRDVHEAVAQLTIRTGAIVGSIVTLATAILAIVFS